MYSSNLYDIIGYYGLVDMLANEMIINSADFDMGRVLHLNEDEFEMFRTLRSKDIRNTNLKQSFVIDLQLDL